ncbi:MAG: methylenetetrahydrofolate reductase [Desulfosarcina sp.]|nr:methylenetetrahydrofolate reductase [Desulfobacterales bacterium]
MHQNPFADSTRFKVIVEVVPPAGADAGPILLSLKSLGTLPIDAFNVATNPVARARMSAFALCALIQQQTGRPAVLHCTTRDHNALSIQALLWGARALGIQTVLVTTGDFVALGDRAATTTVRDLDVFDLVKMAREASLCAGVAFDPHSDTSNPQRAVKRLADKAAAGAQFAVTQPVYDKKSARWLLDATRHIDIPIIMGILPLRTPRHAEFLHQQVSGISVPRELRQRLKGAQDPVAEGAANAREMLAVAREDFAGACIMPPFDHYEVLADILKP